MKAKSKMCLWQVKNGWMAEVVKLPIVKETDCFYWIDGPIPKKIDKRSQYQMEFLFKKKSDALKTLRHLRRECMEKEVKRLRLRITRCRREIKDNARTLAGLMKKLAQDK